MIESRAGQLDWMDISSTILVSIAISTRTTGLLLAVSHPTHLIPATVICSSIKAAIEHAVLSQKQEIGSISPCNWH